MRPTAEKVIQTVDRLTDPRRMGRAVGALAVRIDQASEQFTDDVEGPNLIVKIAQVATGATIETLQGLAMWLENPPDS